MSIFADVPVWLQVVALLVAAFLSGLMVMAIIVLLRDARARAAASWEKWRKAEEDETDRPVLSEAEQAYAESLNRTANKLTEAQKKAAFDRAVLQAARQDQADRIMRERFNGRRIS